MADPFDPTTLLAPTTPPQSQPGEAAAVGIPLFKTPVSGGTQPAGAPEARNEFGRTSQEQWNIDQMFKVRNPIEQLGYTLFGPEPAPGQKDGFAIGGLAGLAIKPVEWLATGLSRIPTGWIPGGSDAQFRQIGDFQQRFDPEAYKEWQLVNESSNADILGGGNLKSDYTREWSVKYLDKTRGGPQGLFANRPELMSGPAGSLGGNIVDALNILAIPGLAVQQWLGKQKIFAPVIGETAAGKQVVSPTAPVGDRVSVVEVRAAAGGELNAVEQEVVDRLADGSWTREHAQNYLIRNNAGLFRDFPSQLVASILTDPVSVAQIGAGTALKLGRTGQAVVEAGLPAASNLQRLGKVVYDVQRSDVPGIQGTFKAARTFIDPFSLIGRTSAERGTLDLLAGGATKAVENSYGPQWYSSAFRLAARNGLTDELQSSLGVFADNMARKWVTLQNRIGQLKATGLGEQLADIAPESIVDQALKSAPKDAVPRLTEYIDRIKRVFTDNPAEDTQLAQRLALAFGRTPGEWTDDVARMSNEEKSLWHAATYSRTWGDFQTALTQAAGDYNGKMNLSDLVILNDNNLDNIAAEALRAELSAAKSLADRTDIWQRAAQKWTDIADLGQAEPSEIVMDALERRLDELISSGALHTRLLRSELADDPALQPLLDWLNSSNIDGQQVWNLGFRPPQEFAWGLRRDRATGLLRISGDPSIPNVSTAKPAHRPINDALRNLVGQYIGPAPADVVARPIEALEVAFKTASDIVSSTRLMFNIEQRFTRNMARYGLAPRQASEAFSAIRRAAQLDQNTIAGMRATNIWRAVESTIPVTSKNEPLINQRDFVNALLDAASGDLRIIGLTGGFTQRIRTAMQASGLAGTENYAGQATVQIYRLLRYSLNPIFYIQRITDGAYFNILKGVHPVGGGRFDENSQLGQVQRLLSRIGETGMARDFQLTDPEFHLRTAIRDGIKERIGLTAKPSAIERLSSFGARWQTNNQVAYFSSRLGSIVREAIDEARATFSRLANDQTLTEADRQSYRDALNGLTDFAAFRRQYSINAGRVLSDDEVGLKYIQEMYIDSLGAEVTSDGIIKFKDYITKGTYHKPATIGEVGSLQLDNLAAELGFLDEFGNGDLSALRTAIGPSGRFSTRWVRERLVNDFNADPSYVKRAVNALQFDWEKFWGDVATKLDLVREDSLALQGIIAREAIGRGMTPVDYLSQVLMTNLDATAPSEHLGKLLQVVRAAKIGSTDEQIARLTDIFTSTLDLSGQRLQLQNFREVLPRLIDDARTAGDSAKLTNLSSIRYALENVAAAPTGTAAAARGVPQTVDEYAAFYRLDEPYRATGEAVAADGSIVEKAVQISDAIGPGLRAAPPEQANLVIQHIASLREQFPSAAFGGVEVEPLLHVPVEQGGWGFGNDIAGTVIGAKEGMPTLLLSPNAFGPGAQAYWSRIAAEAEDFKLLPEGTPFVSGRAKAVPAGVPREATGGPIGLIYHEVAHAIDSQLRGEFGYVAPATAPYRELMSQLESGDVAKLLSDYANVSKFELAAELFDVAFNPTVDRNTLNPLVQQAINDYRKVLEDIGVYRPVPAPALSELDAPLRAANNAAFAELVARRAAGEAISNPDVEAIVRAFTAWTRDAVAAQLGTSRAWVGQLVNTLTAQIPTDGAFLANRSQMLIEQLLQQKMRLAQQDAFRLAEMSTQRTVASRSLNHPVFGFYPTSYMWGKVLPEMVQFIAKNPFGMETGAFAYQMAKVEMAIAAQREYDPEFATIADRVGNSEVAFLADYLTPSLPWSDMRAATPPWAQALAKRGIDPSAMLDAQFATEGTKRWYDLLFRATKEAVNLGKELISQRTPQETSLESQVIGQAPTIAQPVGGVIDLSQGVSAGEMGPILEQQMRSLEELLTP